MNIIRELRHPYIVRYFDRIIDKHATKLYMVTEYCENGDLGALIKRHHQNGYDFMRAFVRCCPLAGAATVVATSSLQCACCCSPVCFNAALS